MPCFKSPVADAGRGRTDDSYISFILSVACTMAYTMGSGADRKRDHYAFGKRNNRPLQMLLGRDCAPAARVRPDQGSPGPRDMGSRWMRACASTQRSSNRMVAAVMLVMPPVSKGGETS